MAVKKGKKTAPQTALRKPKHGRGALLTGGMPGNKGGTGRPASELREHLRGSFADRIKVLEQFADGSMPLKEKCKVCGHEEASTLANALPVEPSDRLRAIDMLAKYGLGTMKEVSVENVRDRVGRTLDVIRQHCSAEQATSIITALRPVWA